MSNQLLPNRGILSMVNPVVRKNVQHREKRVPAEWGETTAEAYRLLVGPRIKEYIDEDDDSSELKASEIETSSLSRRSKLISSIRKMPLPEIEEQNLDSLTLPDDLLVHVAPQEELQSFDKLTLPERFKATRKIKKPLLTQPVIKPQSSLIITSSRLMTPIKPLQDPEEESVEEEESAPQVEVKVEPEKPQEIKKKEPVKSLRVYFYVLRCWARYRINAKLKSEFICTVNDTRMEIHALTRWKVYVLRKHRLKRLQTEFEEQQSASVRSRSFELWKKKADKAISHAGKALIMLNNFNTVIQRRFFRAFYDVTISKRVCRREINRLYRYNENGPFTPICSHYDEKRSNTIKAKHHFFIKHLPPFVSKWRRVLERSKQDRKNVASMKSLLRRIYFHQFYDSYREHLHMRTMIGVRERALGMDKKHFKQENAKATKAEKSTIIQLIKDKEILSMKLSQFDRLSQNHREAVLTRRSIRKTIKEETDEFFRKQEELQLVDVFKQASEVEKKTRELRVQLAEGFVYRMARSIRSFDNQVVAHEFSLAFRVLSQPVVEKAVGYFYEKKHLTQMINTAYKIKSTIDAMVSCCALYHQSYGFGLWRKFTSALNEGRTPGLMKTIRRRTAILQLYPFFDWVEVLPVRPPRPLKDVEAMFKDLPLVSIQRKVARERVHHINVRMMLIKRRILRDFFRAYAAFVQEQIATRQVIRLIQRKRSEVLLRNAFSGFMVAVKQPLTSSPKEKSLTADIRAWHIHFFRTRNKQHRLANRLQ